MIQAMQKTRKARTPQRRPQPRPQRPDQDLVDMVIFDFPQTLKRALIKASNREKSNLTNVAVACLARKYEIEFVPTDRRSSSIPGDSDKVSFAMPRQLRHAIRMDAAERDMNRRDVVIEALLACYGKKR